MDRLCEVLSSSIGRKVQVAVAGLLLCLFLISHLAGNLLLWAGPETYNHYAEALAKNLLLPAAEVGLLAVFLAHVLVALRVRYLNRKARPVGYDDAAWAGGRTVASASMLWTGLVVLLFLVVHLKTMRFVDHGGDLYAYVIGRFQSAPYALFYLVCMAALGLHLSHGAQAAARTLGLDHPRYMRAIQRGGQAFALVVAAGFGALAFWAGWLAGGRP